MPNLTADAVLALAPDAAAAKAGRDLAAARKWVVLGQDGRAAWGECQGSGKLPYQVQAELAELAYRCSCPSRKLPCKHVLGLLLLAATTPEAVAHAQPPEWVEQWLAARSNRAERAAARAGSAPGRTADPAATEAAAAARRDTRLAKVRAGLEELALWLADLVRLGLAAVARQPAAYWNAAAARLIDAQAPGAARLVDELGGVATSGQGWEERLLAQLGRLHLLIEGFSRLESLPAVQRADVLATVGVPLRQEDVLAGAGVRDCWLVAGRHVTSHDRLRTRRTWLLGRESDRAALLLAFAAGQQPLEPGPLPGSAFTAELAFYPGAWPLRAIVQRELGPAEPPMALTGHAEIAAAVRACATAAALNPWLEELPLALRCVLPALSGTNWSMQDTAGRTLPLSPRFEGGWKLLALGGGRPLDLFGEWDGASLLPLGAVAGGRFTAL